MLQYNLHLLSTHIFQHPELNVGIYIEQAGRTADPQHVRKWEATLTRLPQFRAGPR